VQFVIADVGAALRWIPTTECLEFWKDEAKTHLSTETRAVLDGFPDAYFYLASQWEGPQFEAPVIVMERHH